jgi:hypothetical protein
MTPVDPVHVDELLEAVRRDPRVEQVSVTQKQSWSWVRGKTGDGRLYSSSASIEIQPNIVGHGAGGRGISAGSGPLTVARVEIDNGLITECELVHGQAYGLVRLVADALGCPS